MNEEEKRKKIAEADLPSVMHIIKPGPAMAPMPGKAFPKGKAGVGRMRGKLRKWSGGGW